jgi:hypothetical protein
MEKHVQEVPEGLRLPDKEDPHRMVGDETVLAWYLASVAARVNRATGEVERVVVVDEGTEFIGVTNEDFSVRLTHPELVSETTSILDGTMWPGWEFGW